MTAFAVAAFHEARLPAGATGVEAVVWLRADGLGSPGVEVALRLWTPAGVTVVALREVEPDVRDVLAGAERLDERTLLVEAGRWEDGVHEYELELALPARAVGEAMLAARVDVVAGGERAGGTLVAIRWTDVAPAGSAPAHGSGGAGGAVLTAAVADDVPTGASPEPRHGFAGQAGDGGPCAACGELPDPGDRFCEVCGGELATS